MKPIPRSRDDTFMDMVYTMAQLSKDENTHIGAVIVGPDHEIRSTGFNSFPRGLNDTLPERQERPEKYFWIEHAERNAIYNAARVGIPLKGCRIYTNGTPCMDCARAIIQAGISEVIIDSFWEVKFSLASPKWLEHKHKAEEMFRETGIAVREIDYTSEFPVFMVGEYLARKP